MNNKINNRRASFGGGFLQAATTNGEAVNSSDSFEEGLKIAADNKINGVNTWNLALIDYFADMTLLRDEKGINFQKVSYTLDGCVKVYTSRVDSFEAETKKLLMGLNDKHSTSDNKNDENPEGNNAEESKQKRRKNLAKTLEDNQALSVEKYDMDFSQDPLFQKTAADFDEGGAKGLLLSHLDLSDDAARVIFDASDLNDVEDSVAKFNAEGLPILPPAIALSGEVDMVGFKSKFNCKLSNLMGLQICPTFSTFLFNPSADGTIQDFSVEGVNREDFYYTEGMENEDDDDEVYELEGAYGEEQEIGKRGEDDAFGFLGEPQAFGNDDYDDGPLMDFDMPADPSSNNSQRQQQQQQQHQQQQQKREMVERSVMRMVAATNTTQKSQEDMFKYFDTIPGKNWAGPEFWKSRAIKTQNFGKAATADASKAGPAKKKGVAAVAKLDFLNPPEVLNADSVFARTKASIVLPKQKGSFRENLHLLPEDHQFSSDRFLTLFLKPKFKVHQVLKSISIPLDKSTTPNQIQNSEQADEYQYGGFDMDDDDDELGAADFPETFKVIDQRSLRLETSLHESGGVPDNNSNSFQLPVDEGVGSLEMGEFGDDNYGERPDEFSHDAPHRAADVKTFDAGGVEDVKSDMKPTIISLSKYKQRQIPLYFAKTAKRVDVAKLKENLWNRLAEEENEIKVKKEKLGDDDQDDEVLEIQAPKKSHGTMEKSFTQIVSKLDDCYGEKQRKDISVAFCFICVLHLANENNLTISEKGMKELVITSNEG